MNRRLLGGVLAAAGVVLVVLSVFADSIGIGNEDGFGTKQTIETIAGAVVLVGGFALMYVAQRGEVLPTGEE